MQILFRTHKRLTLNRHIPGPCKNVLNDVKISVRLTYIFLQFLPRTETSPLAGHGLQPESNPHRSQIRTRPGAEPFGRSQKS